MTNHARTLLLTSTLLVLGVSQGVYAACDQTLNPGANVASAVSNAANGSTVCLNAGNYGTVTFSKISKSSYVTVQSTSGRGATISPQVSDSDFLRFTSLTISGAQITQCASNVEITSSTFTKGLLVNMRGSSCSYPLNIKIDGNIFSNLSPAGYEGRISVADDDGPQTSMGVVISNNEIRDGCLSDGVQLVGGASGIQIGPGNDFSNIVQSGSVHCDNIQFYGSGQNNSIIQNRFRSGSTFLTHHTSAPKNTVIRGNVFDGTGDGAQYKLQIGQSSNVTFEHNTLKNAGLSINSGSSAVVRNNAFVTSSYTQAGGTGPCSSCTVSYNLFSSGASGTNAITGNPTFVGGASPSAWAGYQLTSTSLGFKAGSDGQDMGTTYYGTGTPLLGTPANLRLVTN